MHELARTVSLNLRMTKRLALRRNATLRERAGPLDERLVFVVGSPRSGTTFLAGAIGSVPGLVDLGEVAPLKAAIPGLATARTAVTTARLRTLLSIARRFGLVGSVRAVEQTPEMSFLIDAAAAAFPQARFVHILRDGRDVACSLLERGWLGNARTGEADDAGLVYGSGARFWVEPERRAEFTEASDARRAAWVWRRYVGAVRSAETKAFELRYEQLADDPHGTARDLAAFLETAEAPLTRALTEVHSSSIGRWRRDLTSDQLSDIEAEAGPLLRELGYTG